MKQTSTAIWRFDIGVRSFEGMQRDSDHRGGVLGRESQNVEEEDKELVDDTDEALLEGRLNFEIVE